MAYRLISVMGLLLLGCALSRPEFQEPRWGNAPAPLASEITEITKSRRSCTIGSCRDERIVLRRDGLVSHEFQTGKLVDSLFVARIDSVAFLALAGELRKLGFFGGGEEEGSFQPLASESTVISAATLCRRKTGIVGVASTSQDVLDAIDEAVAKLSWQRCCRM